MNNQTTFSTPYKLFLKGIRSMRKITESPPTIKLVSTRLKRSGGLDVCLSRALLSTALIGCAFLVLGLLAWTAQSKPKQPWEVVKISRSVAKESGAWCLDGSTPQYYISHGPDRRKWIIFHEGGDWCDRIQRVTGKAERPTWSCSERARTFLGSSELDAQSKNQGNMTEYGREFEYLSRDAARNPMMHDWTHVLIRYCDGGSFSGNSSAGGGASGDGGGEALFLRGKPIQQAVADDLLRHRDLASATDVVLAGASAGALGVLLQADDWGAQIEARARSAGGEPPRMAALLDAGIFPEWQDSSSPACRYRERMERVYSLHRPVSSALGRCVGALGNGSAPWSCLFGANLLPFVEMPVFAVSSVHDAWMLSHVICNASAEVIADFGASLAEAIAGAVRLHGQAGAFVEPCHHHTKCWADVTVEGQTPAEAFSEWYRSAGQGRMLWAAADEPFGSAACNDLRREPSCPVTVF
uniref:Pectin acetylesterase n=1 Tax=Tetraselmis sp. GSL018 TaxID=582737 RepID=A0A061R971_9CHLO